MKFEKLEQFIKNNQKECAQFMQVSECSASYYARGLKTMGIDKLYRLCKAYNISADNLLGINVKMSDKTQEKKEVVNVRQNAEKK